MGTCGDETSRSSPRTRTSSAASNFLPTRTWWNRIRGAFDEARWELLEIRVSGNRAVARVRIAGTMSGVPMEQTMWQAIELREGKASRWAFFRSEREALEATESWPQ